MSREVKFPDNREITGNFRLGSPPRLQNSVETRDFLDEFPAIGTGNFLLQTGKDNSLTASSTFGSWPKADVCVGHDCVAF